MKYKEDARLKDKYYLEREYITKNRSLNDIAEEIGVCLETVRKKMKKFGIDRRDFNLEDKELIGQTFGFRKILEYSGKNKYKVLCSCGYIGVFTFHHIKNNGICRNCGNSGKYLEYQGEKKTAFEWSLDERCKVDLVTLQQRLYSHWDIEKAFIVKKRNSFGREDENTIVGRKYNRLLIEAFSIYFNKAGKNYRCECLCDCGERSSVDLGSLKTGSTKSCGCLRLENSKSSDENEESYIKSTFFRDYEKGAKTRNIEFLIDKDLFYLLVKQNCFYCDQSPQLRRNRYAKTLEIHANGLDRIDSKGNYSKENCVPCCSLCNYAKLKFSQEEFLDMVKRIYENLIMPKKLGK